jgi:proline dehydrogenase
MLRGGLLAAARSPRAEARVRASPLTRPLVRRFVAGEDVDTAIATTAALVGERLRVSLDHLGEDTTCPEHADASTVAYTDLLARLGETGLAEAAEVSVKLSAIGASLPADGEKVALDNARRICEAAIRAGTTVTIDMEDHTTTEQALGIVASLRADHPWVGAVVQAQLRRTEGDCRDLAGPGSRVRLCKGAYAAPSSVAFGDKAEVDRSYVRCLRVLLQGSGYPMIATHDPRMLTIAAELARRRGRGPADHEFQMLYGMRPTEQARIANGGNTLRVYLPYGTAWYGYFTRRLAERPANLAFFLRSLATHN